MTIGTATTEPTFNAGFSSDLWRRVLPARGVKPALAWLGITAFCAAFAPLLANGHPLLLREIAPHSGTRAFSSPFLMSLSRADWLVLIWVGIGCVIWCRPGRAYTHARLELLLAVGVHLMVFHFGLAALMTLCEALDVGHGPGAVRGLSTIGAGALATAAFVMLPAMPSRVGRAAVSLGLTGACVIVAAMTWSRPPQHFPYRQLEREGRIAAVYTLAPWSPAQREDDRNASFLPPGSTSDQALARAAIAGLDPARALDADARDAIQDRIRELPLDSDVQQRLSAAVERAATQAPAGVPTTIASVHGTLARELADSGPRHLLGTDGYGQDVLSQIVHASRLSLTIGLISTGIAVAIGVFLGALMGYFGGWVDLILSRVVEVFMAIPLLFLLIVIAGVLPDRSTYAMMAVIGCVTWPGAARYTRAEFLKLREQEFVQAARAAGLPAQRIVFRHMLPCGVAPVLVDASFAVAAAILAEAVLSFLGLGPPDQPSWGRLLAGATGVGSGFAWWLGLFPGILIFLTVLSYNTLGEALRAALDPRVSTPGAASRSVSEVPPSPA